MTRKAGTNDDASTKSRPSRRTILRLTGGAGLAALGIAPSPVTGGAPATRTDVNDTYRDCELGVSKGDDTATWTKEAAQKIERTEATTAPVIEELNEAAPNLHVWDFWPLRNTDGSVACVDGWSVLFALTSPDEVLPGKRHDIAEIRYFYSREGYQWQLGGPVFVPGTAKGNRQWAASAVYDPAPDENEASDDDGTDADDDADDGDADADDADDSDADDVTEDESGDDETEDEASASDESGDVFIFYTATGRSGNPNDPRSDDVDITYEQRLALAEGATLETSREGVDLEGVWDHSIVLTADGDHYQTQEQAGDGIIYAFRDPWYFEDPETGCKYLLFEGNTPTDTDETDCERQDLDEGDYTSGVAATGAQFNGNIGIAVSEDGEDMSEWELLPPLIDAVCVNQQLERGNVFVSGGKYYLFCDSHRFTFPEDLDGPDGMYGFVADSLHGDYEPLNESGLVVANPEEQPFQAYSWMPVPYEDEDRMAVLSYYNYFDLGETTLTGVGDLSRQEQQAKFGGTFAPTLVVELDGDTTEIVDTLDPGFIPSACSNPPI